MAKEWAQAFYKSKKWLKCRNSYIQERIMIDGGMCEECKQRIGYIVHHKITLTPTNIENPDVSLNHSNLEYVCKDCHDKFEGHGVGNKSPEVICMFDEDGNPICRKPPYLKNTI